MIFAMVSFVSFSFISALIFMILFLLLTLGFIISCFSTCFQYSVGLFIWLFSCFLRYACFAMNLPLSTGFTESNRFWVVSFSFSFISMHILIYFVVCWLFRGLLYSLHIFVFLIAFFSCSVQFNLSIMSDSLQPHEPQHTTAPCPSPTPRVHCVHDAIQPSHPLSSQMSQLSASGGQSIGVSASTSVPPMNAQD